MWIYQSLILPLIRPRLGFAPITCQFWDLNVYVMWPFYSDFCSLSGDDQNIYSQSCTENEIY